MRSITSACSAGVKWLTHAGSLNSLDSELPKWLIAWHNNLCPCYWAFWHPIEQQNTLLQCVSLFNCSGPPTLKQWYNGKTFLNLRLLPVPQRQSPPFNKVWVTTTLKAVVTVVFFLLHTTWTTWWSPSLHSPTNFISIFPSDFFLQNFNLRFDSMNSCHEITLLWWLLFQFLLVRLVWHCCNGRMEDMGLLSLSFSTDTATLSYRIKTSSVIFGSLGNECILA